MRVCLQDLQSRFDEGYCSATGPQMSLNQPRYFDEPVLPVPTQKSDLCCMLMLVRLLTWRTRNEERHSPLPTMHDR